MLVIEGKNKDGRPATLTLSTERAGKIVTRHLRMYEPSPAEGPLAGKLLADITLNAADTAELKRNL